MAEKEYIIDKFGLKLVTKREQPKPKRVPKPKPKPEPKQEPKESEED